MRKLIAILLLTVYAYALDDVNIIHTFVSHGVINADSMNANYDSIKVIVNQDNDSLENSFIRFTDLSSHDSTLHYLGVDTIRSKPDVDTILGKPFIDSIETIHILVPDSIITKGLNITKTLKMDSSAITTGVSAVRATLTAGF